MRSALLPLLLLLAACGDSGSKASTARVESAGPCTQQLFEGDRFTVCDARSGRIELFAAARNQAPVRCFADLEASLGAAPTMSPSR